MEYNFIRHEIYQLGFLYLRFDPALLLDLQAKSGYLLQRFDNNFQSGTGLNLSPKMQNNNYDVKDINTA